MHTMFEIYDSWCFSLNVIVCSNVYSPILLSLFTSHILRQYSSEAYLTTILHCASKKFIQSDELYLKIELSYELRVELSYELTCFLVYLDWLFL